MNEATLQYVRQHADDDVRLLALRGSKDPAVDLSLALQQISGLQTARHKLPTWAATEGLLYPPHLSMEQCSSEQTARYKCSVWRDLIAPSSGSSSFLSLSPRSLVDLTGGLGVDFSFLAPLFDEATYVEQQEALCSLARHNFPLLGLDCSVVCANSTDYLIQLKHATLIFIDPARRDSNGGRTYAISDCTPDVLTLRDLLLEKADFVILKLSPMLDWHKAVNDLGRQWVREVHIVSVGGECKELLIVLSASHTASSESLRVCCVNDDVVFEYHETEENRLPLTTFASPMAGNFLYEPNASVMKAGCFKVLTRRFPVHPIAQNSHLFLADSLIDNFPGRRFRIVDISSLNKKELKEKISPLKQANITVRNFPLTVAELRQRLKLGEGGSHYIFATTLANDNRVLLICRQLLSDTISELQDDLC
jgi:hypothetical protein